MTMMLRAILLVLLVFAVNPALAHKPSDSYLTLRMDGQRVDGQWDIALRDLDHAIGLDADQDGAITWGEVKARRDVISHYALARLAIGSCAAASRDLLIDNHSDGAYAVLMLTADCKEVQRPFTISYHLFFDLDPMHRGLLNVSGGGFQHTAIFSADSPVRSFSLERPSWMMAFADYFKDGVIHIWVGYDHILFLLSLLLPAVLVWTGKWSPAGSFRESFIGVVKIVTAFTVAHSITLSIAALGLVSLPSRLVESLIAASVIAAACNNIYPFVRAARWAIAFGFGLVHGFGFASVLGDLGLPQDTMLAALIAFNLGVEAGQLAIVAVFLPLAFLLRSSWFYTRMVMVGGSCAVMLVAAVWLAQRALNIEVVPGFG
jgi:hypothetical protein